MSSHSGAIHYRIPTNWIKYDAGAILSALVGAKSTLASLQTIPYQKSWADELQAMQLKREVAGTSRIEGADFTERELDAAMREDAEALETRSQKQAAAAVKAYRWISNIEDAQPFDLDLLLHIHRLLVTNADDDHCPPGKIRGQDQNVTFGAPRHRGVDGGGECSKALELYCEAIHTEFRGHDPLIQSLAAHYHLAAMHPFLDGNGRTARAVEALLLQRVGLKDTLFIAMSNYYYEEKTEYLKCLAKVRAEDHDLTSFLMFGLKGIEMQCKRLFQQIRVHVSKALYKNLMFSLFNRLQNPRKRVLADRQLETLKILLDKGETPLVHLLSRTRGFYKELSNPHKMQIRDINQLITIKAIEFRKDADDYILWPNLNWPQKMTESAFYEAVQNMPKSKTHAFLN